MSDHDTPREPVAPDAQNPLRHLEAIWAGLIQDANLTIYVLDPEGRPLFTNRAFEALWGVTAEQLNASGYNILRDQQLAAKGLMPYLKRSFEGEATTWPIAHYDPGALSPTSHERWVETYSYPVKGEDGRVVAVVLMHHDVSARARLQQELAAANEALKRQRDRIEAEVAARTQELQREQGRTQQQTDLADSIINNAPAGIIYYDADLVIRRVNPTITELLGLPAERLLDRRVTEVFPGLDVEGHYGPVLRLGETVRQINFEHRYEVNGQEALRYWDFVNVPIYDGQRVVGILGMASEVSERVEKERLQLERLEALEQANVHKDQFLGIISHELRTPINAIMGFSSILDDGLAGPLTDEQHGYLGKILAGTERLLALVDDLLDMSRIQAGKFSIAPTRLMLDKVVENALASIAPAASAKQITVRNRVAPATPALLADEQRITQVLSNLVGNAIKFTQPGGWIEVRAAVDGEVVRVMVEDNGPGIDEASQASLFDPFTQLDMSKTRRIGGVGLGLSIVKNLVEAHGGEIGVASRPGRGATFWFTLPIAAASD